VSETIFVLNKRLEDRYGLGPDSLRSLWKLSWSNTQFEKRYGTYRDYVRGTNILLREVNEVREVRKYPYIENRWLLERLVPVPDINQDELITKLSYECVWAFKLGQLPTWLTVEFLVDVCHTGMTKHNLPDRGPNSEEAIEERRKRIETIQEELFGDESDIADSIHYGAGIVVPNQFNGTVRDNGK